MKKRMLSFCIQLCILFPYQSFAMNENVNNLIHIVVNDQLVLFDEIYPIVRNGKTYVPIRFVVEHLNVSMQWDDLTNQVILKKGNKEILIDIATKSLCTNGGQIIPEAVFLEEDRTMISYKLIANYFGYEVSYIDEGPIARATNKKLIANEEELVGTLRYKMKKETERILTKMKRKNKIVYLTFDDGPSEYTNEILSILKKYDCKATFFMLSNRIRKDEHMVSKIVEDENAVGLHGVSHNYKKIYRSPNTVVDEMNICNHSLEKAAGIRTNLIRVPYGSVPYMTKPYRQAVEKEGYKLWDWNIDGRDSLSKNVTSSDVIKAIKKQIKYQKTPVILLHEKKWTVQALPYILEYLKENGYRTVIIDQNEKPMNFWNQR